MEGGRLDETAALLRCLCRLSSKAKAKCQADVEGGSRGASAVSSRDQDGKVKVGAGWVAGYRAVLSAVQELVRKRTGGATLALIL